jgi:hypothetical protein
MSMASLPGNTVWQKDMMPGVSFSATAAPVPSTQYGKLSNGFFAVPS